MMDYGPQCTLFESRMRCDDQSTIVLYIYIYDNSIEYTNAVLISNTQGKLFKITVGMIQGCIPSPILFNFFFEEIMAEI